MTMPESDGELIIEVELDRNAPDLASMLSPDAHVGVTPEFMAMSAMREFDDVLGRFGMLEVQPAFASDQIQNDRAERAAIAEAAKRFAIGPEQRRASARESIPQLDRFLRLRFPAGTRASEITEALENLPVVRRAVKVPGELPPNDPLLGQHDQILTDPDTGHESQWYLHRTNTPGAWSIADGSAVVIADIDWGFRTTHRELKTAIEYSYNVVDRSTKVDQGNPTNITHGTGVLGIAGARANGVGTMGYAPQAALWAIKADGAPALSAAWARAIDHVRTKESNGRRKVMILEVQTGNGGNYEEVPTVNAAIRTAIADNCVVCVAAGNGDRPADISDDGKCIPATGSILVGATAFDKNVNKRWHLSNFGENVTVCAPGDKLHDITCVADSDDAYSSNFGGTSGAAPKVAGTIALMLSVNSRLTHTDVREILTRTGSAVITDPGKPVGVFLNTQAAVEMARDWDSGVKVSTPADESLVVPGGVDNEIKTVAV